MAGGAEPFKGPSAGSANFAGRATGGLSFARLAPCYRSVALGSKRSFARTARAEVAACGTMAAIARWSAHRAPSEFAADVAAVARLPRRGAPV